MYYRYVFCVCVGVCVWGGGFEVKALKYSIVYEISYANIG